MDGWKEMERVNEEEFFREYNRNGDKSPSPFRYDGRCLKRNRATDRIL